MVFSISFLSLSVLQFYYSISKYGDASDPLAEMTYVYDSLDRVSEITYDDTSSGEETTWGYSYSSDGNLAGITKNGALVYTYDYDTLGRLIHSSALEDGEIVLNTDHQYDTSDRILSQNWQIGDDGYEEAYAYNEKDGTLSQMTASTSLLIPMIPMGTYGASG